MQIDIESMLSPQIVLLRNRESWITLLNISESVNLDLGKVS